MVTNLDSCHCQNLLSESARNYNIPNTTDDLSFCLIVHLLLNVNFLKKKNCKLWKKKKKKAKKGENKPFSLLFPFLFLFSFLSIGRKQRKIQEREEQKLGHHQKENQNNGLCQSPDLQVP